MFREDPLTFQLRGIGSKLWLSIQDFWRLFSFSWLIPEHNEVSWHSPLNITSLFPCFTFPSPFSHAVPTLTLFILILILPSLLSPQSPHGPNCSSPFHQFVTPPPSSLRAAERHLYKLGQIPLNLCLTNVCWVFFSAWMLLLCTNWTSGVWSHLPEGLRWILCGRNAPHIAFIHTPEEDRALLSSGTNKTGPKGRAWCQVCLLLTDFIFQVDLHWKQVTNFSW